MSESLPPGPDEADRAGEPGPLDPDESSDRDPPADPAVPQRLDPHRAVEAVGGRPAPVVPVVDTRRYQWMIGIFGVLLLAAFSVYLLVHNGVGTPGIPAGGHMHEFVAPLATSAVNLPANANPHCDPAHPNPSALNVCNRKPLVLDFFVTGSGDCTRAVGTLQRIAPRFPGVEFAAVSVRGSQRDTASLVRSHHWTLPVGVDEDGRVGDVYGVEICPMIELARAGGLVVARLVGTQWLDPGRLAAAVRRALTH